MFIFKDVSAKDIIKKSLPINFSQKILVANMSWNLQLQRTKQQMIYCL